MNPVIYSFRGASGTNYSYYAFGMDFRPKDSQLGNYMFARQSSEARWVPVYIGHGDLKALVSDKTHLSQLRKKGATHILARVNMNEQLRRVEAQDMLAGHPEACMPTGCNENKSVKPAPLRVAQKRN